jgi:nicotinamide-nucleotide amidase
MSAEEQLGALLRDLDLTITVAESCTGGLLAHRITNVPGSSAYFLGGFVAYSDKAKELLLGVRHETLVAHGAVSKETAREMARGAQQEMGADLAISITGIAGPTGGTPDKPVGTVYMVLATPNDERSQHHVWQGDRLQNKAQSVEAALRLVLSYLQERCRSSLAKVGGIVDFVNEPVSVEVYARPEGAVRPLAFRWQQRRYEIESWGREATRTHEGCDVRCYLVQTAGPETWELCRDLDTGQWTLARRWLGKQRVV